MSNATTPETHANKLNRRYFDRTARKRSVADVTAAAPIVRDICHVTAIRSYRFIEPRHYYYL